MGLAPCVAAFLDCLGPFEERQHSPGQVAPATHVEVEDHPSDVCAGSVEASPLTSGRSVPKDLTEELRSDPTPGRGGEQPPVLVIEEGCCGSAVIVLQRTPPGPGSRDLNVSEVTQNAHVVADSRERVVECTRGVIQS